MIYQKRNLENSLSTLLLNTKEVITTEQLEQQRLTEITYWNGLTASMKF